MGSYMNFKNSGNVVEPTNTNPLARQSSIYNMTFDELQHTIPSQDFGSMNMEDLLKSIWTAEESQSLLAPSNGEVPPGNLQRQGSLTLPRTLSQKTVDEVWRDAFKETNNVGVRDGVVGHVGSSLGQREPTFGETTLEEFLFRAGVVREDTVVPNACEVFDNLPVPNGSNNSSSSFTLGFQEPLGISSGEILNVNNVVASQQTQPKLLQPLFPKQTNMNFSSNNEGLFNPRTKVMVTDLTASPLNPTGKSVAIGGLLGDGVSVSGVSPNSHVNLNTAVKSGIDVSSSPSPLPYNIGGDVGRGRRRSSASLEKVVERRRKRMIKNRESASRSRARKQAYMLELEAEIAKLKELNQGLRRKQEQFEEMQKNQVLEKTNTTPLGNKRICLLRRTVTGPW